MVTLGLIRHARTQWNLEKKIQGSTDIALSPEGIRQAGLWAEILMPETYDVILSSPLIRARQTSQIISGKIRTDIEYDEDLREQDFGSWEGRRLMDIKVQAPGEIERQESMGWQFCPPGGESRTLVLNRGLRAVKKAVKRLDGKKILIVSHSSVIKTMIYSLLNRAFTPDEPPVLRAYHLHVLTWDKRMQVKTLNHIKLS